MIPKLNAAVESHSKLSDDTYAARICLAKIHWLQENPSAALETLPERGNSTTQHTPLGWLEVCYIQASFIKAAALQALGRDAETRAELRQASLRAPGTRTPELRKWTERLLARACTYSFSRTSETSLEALSEALLSFRAWGGFWLQLTSADKVTPTFIDTPPRHMWKCYYWLLSTIVQRGLLPELSESSLRLLSPAASGASEEQNVAAKLVQRGEIKRIESTYELLLLNETQFPKSSETNKEVEEWIEQAIANWEVLVGPSWTDVELGEGGKESVSRGMLDILYRAATKTFHSTAILRQLFIVHASIQEFELAMYAFDSYVEIVSKGKARAEKTGKHEMGFDNDNVALLTAAEAVRVLCRFGDRVQGEKAVDVARIIKSWLGQQILTSPEHNSDDNQGIQTGVTPPSTESVLHPTTSAAAYRAIGISQAHWARLTYEPEIRTELQADAVAHLHRAQSYDKDSIETAYALARVLAESRDTSAAIDVAKRCIAASDDDDDDDEIDVAKEHARKRQLIPLWHLLALCLTARDEYEPAAKICAMAFDQFDDASILFGAPPTKFRDAEKPELTHPARGLVDQMDGLEKESIVQIKLTELSFVELTEGAGVAVNMTDDLLGLYARLFGTPEPLKLARKPTTADSASPSKAGGTLRSLAGSIRAISGRHSGEKNQPEIRSPPKTDAISSRAPSAKEQTLQPIAITVTNEDGVPAAEKHHDHHHHLSLPFRHHAHSNASANKPVEGVSEKSGLSTGNATPANSPEVTNGTTSNSSATGATAHPSAAPETLNDPRQDLGVIPHNGAPDQWPSPAGHEDQPLTQNVRLPAPHPAIATGLETRLASLQERQHKVGLLVKIWLFIAGLYVRADLYDDASDAITQAARLVEIFEAEKSSIKLSARALNSKGWGGGASVDELWANVWSAVSSDIAKCDDPGFTVLTMQQKGDLASARDLPFAAIAHYEQALSYFPDHPHGIIAISDFLMDIYEQKLSPEEPRPVLSAPPTASTTFVNMPISSSSRPMTAKSSSDSRAATAKGAGASIQDPSPAELNRLAARDRAYMLLSNLTRLGSGWDDPEAWYTLARSHELSKQIMKAKQALWWVVELEDCRPIRDWNEITAGGYAL